MSGRWFNILSLGVGVLGLVFAAVSWKGAKNSEMTATNQRTSISREVEEVKDKNKRLLVKVDQITSENLLLTRSVSSLTNDVASLNRDLSRARRDLKLANDELRLSNEELGFVNSQVTQVSQRVDEESDRAATAEEVARQERIAFRERLNEIFKSTKNNHLAQQGISQQVNNAMGECRKDIGSLTSKLELYNRMKCSEDRYESIGNLIQEMNAPLTQAQLQRIVVEYEGGLAPPTAPVLSAEIVQ